MKRTGTEDRIVGPHQHFKQIDAYGNGYRDVTQIYPYKGLVF